MNAISLPPGMRLPERNLVARDGWLYAVEAGGRLRPVATLSQFLGAAGEDAGRRDVHDVAGRAATPAATPGD